MWFTLGCVKGGLSPNEWLFIQRTAHRKRNPACGWTKSCFAGRNPHYVRSKSAGAARRRKSPQNFRSAGFIYPGSYLLSRDLSSDYHRRADVSLPGSEWDRVGPSGYDHQVSGSGFFFASCLSGCHLRLRVTVLCVLAALWKQADIRVACVFVVVHSLPFYIPIKQNCLSPGCCIRSIGC